MKKSTKAVKVTEGTVLVETKESEPVFFYGTITEGKGNKTVTRRVVYAGIQKAPGAMRIGKAVCSVKDRFIKVKGKAIALGRAKSSQPEDVLYLTDDATPVRQFIAKVSKQVDAKPSKEREIELAKVN